MEYLIGIINFFIFLWCWNKNPKNGIFGYSDLGIPLAVKLTYVLHFILSKSVDLDGQNNKVHLQWSLILIAVVQLRN